jgi:4-amino-4-deoxy-L-arabinose transferase-like glycosyltransferase
MAPAVAALFGIGAQALWKLWQQPGRWHKFIVLIILFACAGAQVVLLLPYPGWKTWLIPSITVISLLGLAGLFLFKQRSTILQAVALAWCLFALLIAPLTWTLIPVFTCTNVTLPYAGPQVFEPEGVCTSDRTDYFLDPEWLVIIEQNRGGARYLAATHDMVIATFGILDINQPFMALGGFRGRDPILTIEQFADLVARGEVRYYMAMKDEAEHPVQEGIRQWVKTHCPPASTDDQGILIWGPCDAGR